MSIASAQTVIARGVRVEGDFKSQGNVTIEGELVGSLSCGGHLTIGAEALIEATVHADEATVSGTIQGNVTVKRRLELKATARLKGDIVAETIAIEPGAAMEGMMKIGGGAKVVDKAREVPAAAPKPIPKPGEVVINTPEAEV